MTSIELLGLEFFAHHGLYVEEQQKGNKFLIDISVKANVENSLETDNIDKTVNYEELYFIVAEEMKKPSKLLEHVANRICTRIIDCIPMVGQVDISLSKLDPPLKGPCYASRVRFSKHR